MHNYLDSYTIFMHSLSINLTSKSYITYMFNEYAKESHAHSNQEEKVVIFLSMFTLLVFCFYNCVKERKNYVKSIIHVSYLCFFPLLFLNSLLFFHF